MWPSVGFTRQEPSLTRHELRFLLIVWIRDESWYIWNASWAVFFADRVGAVSQDWPAGFQLERIVTPLPRPWAEYERVSPPFTLTCTPTVLINPISLSDADGSFHI